MVISLIKIIVEIGVLDAAAKKPAIPTMTNEPGLVTTEGISRLKI